MASGNDMKAHSSTYEGFVGLLKWTIPVTALATLIVILIIAS